MFKIPMGSNTSYPLTSDNSKESVSPSTIISDFIQIHVCYEQVCNLRYLRDWGSLINQN